MCKTENPLSFDLNSINKSLPYILDFQNRKWLIDTGSENNYVRPEIIGPKVTRYKEHFKVTTPAGTGFGSEYIIINTSRLFKRPSLMKAYVYKFSEKYDILLGHKTMKNHNISVNFKNNALESDKLKIPINTEINNVTLERGLNLVEFPVTTEKKEVLVNEVNKERYKILEGLYSVKDNKIKVYVDCQECMNILPEPMDIDEDFEIHRNSNDPNTNLDEIKTEVPKLIRTGHMNAEEKEEIIALIKKYPEIIKRDQDLLTATDLIKHKIRTNDENPVYSRNYRYPQYFREDVKIEIEKLLKNKIIRPSNSPYNSPVWVVPKKMDASGKRKIRMVIDYRKLNNKTIDDKFPLPNIEDLFGKIGQANYFSTIDLASGFHQIEMEIESIPKTAFSTEDGHYEFLRMPFGLKNAPPTFQRAMNILFSCLPNVLVYMDDIIIFSNNLHEHIKHLESVFKILKKHLLKIQLDKTEFFKRELLFLGHIISKDGIKPNPAKLESIKSFAIPQNQKQIKQFLGLTGYYRKMIPGYAKIAKPLTAALRTDARIDLSNKDYIESFETLKSLLQNEPILQLPDFKKQFILTTDASNYAIGSVLSQNVNGKDLPISYASRTLNKHEEKLSTIEKELLAIVWACKHFRPYIYGRKILINSDHKPLQYLHNMKDPSAKILRWKCQLADYDIDIKYITGKTNVVADALSRISKEPTISDADPIKDLNNQITKYPDYSLNAISDRDNENTSNQQDPKDDFIGNNADDRDSLITQHSQESSHNQIYLVDDPNKIINVENNQIIINRGNPSNNSIKKLHSTKNRFIWYTNYPYSNNLLELCKENLKPNTTYGVYCSDKAVKLKDQILDQIFLEFQRIIETDFPSIIIKRYYKIVDDIENTDEQKDHIANQHVSKTCHRGINDVYYNLRIKCYWPRMLAQITDYVNNCDTCKRIKYDRAPLKPKFNITLTPSQPFESLQIDTFFYNNHKILTIIDCFSKKLYGYLLKNTTGQEIIKCLRNYFSSFPIPNRIQSDNGPEFKNKSVENFLSYHKIDTHYTTPNYSNSNGLINRAHNTLLELMNIITSEKSPDKISVTETLELSLIAYNNTPNKTLNLTPNEITFGQTNKETSNIILEAQVEKYHQSRELINKSIKKLIEFEKSERTEKLNLNRETVSIPDGNIYVKTNYKHKNKPKYRPTKYSTVTKKILTRGRLSKVHPTLIKRPHTNKKIISVQAESDDGPAG